MKRAATFLALSLALALPAVPAGAAAPVAETDQAGKAHEWKGASPGYTVVDFAASWCTPCWAVLPRLEKYASDHPEIRVLAVSVDDKVSGRDLLVSKLKLTIPVLWDGKHRIAEHYHPEGMPCTVVLDPSGKVVYRHVGSAMKEWDAMVSFLATATKR
jgi:thiol-disulfide isomerase/thioredoxin